MPATFGFADTSKARNFSVIASAPKIEALPHGTKSRERVLIVDDDFGPRTTLEFTLGQFFTVDSAANVPDALAQVVPGRYGVILMDIRMPGMDGLTGVAEVRKIDPLVSVVMLTSYTEIELPQRAMQLGANRYITKPWKVANLLDDVRASLALTSAKRLEASMNQQLRDRIEALEHALKDTRADIPFTEATKGIIHDLSSPLLATIGHAALVLEEVKKLDLEYPGVFASLKEYAQTIERCGEVCFQLAESWQNITNDNRERINVEVGELVHQLHEQIFFRKPELQIVATSPAIIFGVKIDLHRIFQNLIKNAFEAGATSVTVEVIKMPDRVRVIVADNGPGIPEELQAVVFRSRMPSTKHDGNGQGLTIVKHLVRAQSGTITFKSSPAGTTFTTDFPAAK